jgi:hypothetical protein
MSYLIKPLAESSLYASNDAAARARGAAARGASACGRLSEILVGLQAAIERLGRARVPLTRAERFLIA